MMKISRKIIPPGNSPVRDVPADYCPPKDACSFVLMQGPDAGKKMFYRDSLYRDNLYREAEPEATIVFVHGNPESSYTFRHVIDDVIRKAKNPFRLIAMDHIGFGLSDMAGFEMAAKDHASNLFQMIQSLDLKDVTLVVHDWGGPIGIGAFLEEPGRVSNLVIVNSTVFPIPDKGLNYKNFPISWFGWSKTPLIIPDRSWGTFAAYSIFRTKAGPARLLLDMVKYFTLVKAGFFPGNEKIAQKLYRDQFQSVLNVRSSKRMARQSAIWARETPSFYRFIQTNIGHWQNIGVRAVLGRWDPLGSDEVVSQWIKYLPQLEGHVRIFEDAGHFIEESKPSQIAGTIMEVAGLI